MTSPGCCQGQIGGKCGNGDSQGILTASRLETLGPVNGNSGRAVGKLSKKGQVTSPSSGVREKQRIIGEVLGCCPVKVRGK